MGERSFFYCIDLNNQDTRLDLYLSSRPISLSRSKIQAAIKGGEVLVNNHPSKSSYRLKAGDQVCLSIPPLELPDLKPTPVKFDILYEDEFLIVVNKPPGIVVHPAPGHGSGTLVHGLLYHCKNLSGMGGVLRPGIVHRLDKDTSGILLVAKNDRIHASLATQFKTGAVRKEYLALVHGHINGTMGKIDLPVARHPSQRKEMAVTHSSGKRAITLWKKLEEFPCGFSLLSVSLKTGRTHQIRVHLAYMGHPIAGDSLYGYGRRWWKKHPLLVDGEPILIKRQMLHARLIGFFHPERECYMEFESPVPGDMENILHIIKQNTKG